MVLFAREQHVNRIFAESFNTKGQIRIRKSAGSNPNRKAFFPFMGFLSLTDDLMFTHENRTESYD
jgi:hypothetical protein